ncbi:hypothetical protein PILCRDRAFT_13218 [Piloderma croceum F 1598]|uniref:Uncharacterized protein n=1 Tax=Piloderma croceum (strain F 1598) TaxID=765440 RepID=A0A0C3ETI4_PILCF|nr:hypothetical protein PILCRDRAFT_13218 [Piloderma croceum F 1598]
MPDKNSQPQATTTSKRHHEDALRLGPRKKVCYSDPLVSHSRHFGHMVHALCNVQNLLTNGLLRLGELAEEPDESFTLEQRREHLVFNVLLQMIPGLEECLMDGCEDDILSIATMLQKGVSSARSDDTKSLKGAILNWIVPAGQSLTPPIARNIKMDHGFHHERTGALLCPAEMDWSDPQVKENLRNGDLIIPGDQWPAFLYAGNFDREDPWKGLFKNIILVSAYKHVFTSPSSVDNVTPASIAYVTTQVRFALSSSAVFSRLDTITDSERFYNSVLEYFADVDEQEEVKELLIWWNRQVFPSYSSAQCTPAKDGARAIMKEKRALRKRAQEQLTQ